MATSPMEKVTNNSDTNYCKMPDGTLMQWGSSAIEAGKANKQVTFPLSFVDKNYGFSAIGDNSYSYDVKLTQYHAEIQYIYVYAQVNGGITTQNQPFIWLAIGRWK